MPPSNKMFQSGQRNMEFFQDEVFFDRVDGVLVLRAIVIEAKKVLCLLEATLELKLLWNGVASQDFARESVPSVVKEMLPMLPNAIFATDMFAFHWFQVQDAMNSEVFDGIKLSLFLAFLVLLGATQNYLLALISVSCIVAIAKISVSSVLAFAVCMNWKTSVSEAIIYVMVIGLSVDYVIHLGDAYLECPDESREDRVQFMVTKMGVSVISGAISSAGAAIFMTFCQRFLLARAVMKSAHRPFRSNSAILTGHRALAKEFFCLTDSGPNCATGFLHSRSRKASTGFCPLVLIFI
ncbi:disp1 [Symbiodinium natans]|uniref:Disp1 protein n=1 Tax=Symbiodinium natans TaxID=878477 RepID=A0A812IN87_9DINO|nr:disp1 [Symbiodinium natans]